MSIRITNKAYEDPTCEDNILEELTPDTSGSDHQDLAVGDALRQAVMEYSRHVRHF